MSAQQTARAARQVANPEAATAAYQALLARSATDAKFRATLLTDPRTALAEFSGKPVSEIPETLNLKFIENKADATVVLPAFVDTAAELSESELEAVAGGSDLILTAIAVTIAIEGGLISYGIASKTF